MTWPLRAALCTSALLAASGAYAQPAPAPEPAPEAAPSTENGPVAAPVAEAPPPAAPEPAPPVAPAEVAPVAAASAEVTAPVISAPAEPTDADARPNLSATLGPLTLRPIGLVAVQASPYVGSDSFYQAGDIAEQAGFRLRRARLGFSGDIQKRAAFKVSAELGGGDDALVNIHDAWLGYTEWSFLQLYAGAREVPFSRSAMMSSGDSALIERPFAVRAMAPFNQVGVELGGEVFDGALQYQAAVFNGFQRNTQFYEGYVENYAARGNRFDGLAYAVRLGTEPLGDLGETMEDLDHSPFRIGAAGSFFLSDGGTRNIQGIGGDILMHVSGLHVLAEVLLTTTEPETVPTQASTQLESISSFAMVAEAGYMFVRRTFGVTGRFEWIDPNDAIDNEADNWVLSAGASYHLLGDLLKAQADYTHREERAGQSLSNDAVTLQFQLRL